MQTGLRKFYVETKVTSLGYRLTTAKKPKNWCNIARISVNNGQEAEELVAATMGAVTRACEKIARKRPRHRKRLVYWSLIAFVFQVGTHPNVTWYQQCITYRTLPTHEIQVLYSVFGVITMYIIPLIIIIYSYVSILLEIFRRTKLSVRDKMRRSSLGFLGKAKVRTLKMTISIVLVFFICWTPYNVIMAMQPIRLAHEREKKGVNYYLKM
ncbi:7 transmembrane receptor (rhodopsin family) [Popillia japonica]|uniref:7 transmembrane receptor (Rhodopsin family) n=1 Tax=Popillia japonica TaxID=7064 RepID=A0AAW1IEF1_POPJA